MGAVEIGADELDGSAGNAVLFENANREIGISYPQSGAFRWKFGVPGKEHAWGEGLLKEACGDERTIVNSAS